MIHHGNADVEKAEIRIEYRVVNLLKNDNCLNFVSFDATHSEKRNFIELSMLKY